MINLTQHQVDKLLQRRRKLLSRIGTLEQMIRGSVFERYSLCSRPGCRCHLGERHGPRHYVAITQSKKQRQHYIPNPQVEAVRQSIHQWHSLMTLLDEITAINLALMKSGRLDS